MKAEQSVRKGNRVQVVFCLALALVLLCGMFVISGGAAGLDRVKSDLAVDSSSTHTVAVSRGELFVWGTNDYGQFPESELSYTVEPVKTVSQVKSAVAATNRTLVLYENGDLYVYGRDPLTDKKGIADKVDSNVVQMDCAGNFALYVTRSGELKGWGVNESGQLGLGDQRTRTKPVRILDEGVVKTVVGNDFSLALKEDHTLWGWGSNAYLQIGVQNDDGTAPEVVPSPVKIADNTKDMAAGAAYSCILKENGELYTCGMNTSNQTGIYSLESYLPVTKALDHVTNVTAGGSHGFAVVENGDVYSWGFGLTGQLGNRTGERVIGASASDLDFVSLYAGERSSFGVASDGTLWAWGNNTNRLLATASGVDALEPVKVLNADMSWAFSEPAEEPGNDPGGDNGGGSGGAPEEDPAPAVSVSTPFINGNGDGTFRPGSDITRAEFLKMAVAALTDYDDATDYGKSGFTDVNDSKWYAPYIAYAKKNGLISGNGNNTFRPDSPITRAEAAKITALAMKLTCDAEKSTFSDVTGWSVPYVEALASLNVLSGDGDGTFRPGDYITRGEAVKVVGAVGFDPKDPEVEAQISTIKNPFTDVSETKWYYAYILYAYGLVKPAA